MFLYVEDPTSLSEGYGRHFGLSSIEWEPGESYDLAFLYTDPDGTKAHTVFSFMKAKESLAEGRPECLVNWRVADLEAFCAQFEAEGIPFDTREGYDDGRFAWIHGPDGHRVELYQPLQEPGAF